MDLQLMKLRKLAGYKNRDAFAEKIGVNKYTYRSWESGAAMMSLEQACMVADVLECTLDELAGREVSGRVIQPIREGTARLLQRKHRAAQGIHLLQTARDAAGMSKDAAERGVPDAEVGRAV